MDGDLVALLDFKSSSPNPRDGGFDSHTFPPPFIGYSLFAFSYWQLTIVLAVLLAPIALSLAAAMKVNPRPYLVAITFAASTSFATPIGYQTNTMIYAPGGYRFFDYTRVGGPLNFLFWGVAVLVIPLLWPF